MKTSGVKRAALGVRMHSGWGVLVAISGDADSVEVLDRRRIVTADPTISGAKQPYHFAAGLGLREAESYLANCAAVSERLAFEAIKEVVEDLKARRCPIAGSAVLLASGRPLPDLPSILASRRVECNAGSQAWEVPSGRLGRRTTKRRRSPPQSFWRCSAHLKFSSGGTADLKVGATSADVSSTMSICCLSS